MVRPLVVSVAVFTVACALASVSARVVVAAVPGPPNFYFDPVIVGSASAIPIAVGGGCVPLPPGYRVIALDINNVPIPGANVTLDFSLTAIRLHHPQIGGATVNCPARTISRLTNAAGSTTFIPMFGGFENANRVGISIDGVVMGLVPARSTDIDAVDAQTGLNDFALFSAAFVTLIPNAEMNFDNCPPGVQVLSLADFTIFKEQYESAGVGVYCP